MCNWLRVKAKLFSFKSILLPNEIEFRRTFAKDDLEENHNSEIKQELPKFSDFLVHDRKSVNANGVKLDIFQYTRKTFHGPSSIFIFMTFKLKQNK